MTSSKDLCDKEILQRASQGDLAAFEMLVKRYQKLIYGYLYHFFGNSVDAEDITQETFINVFCKLKTHNPAQSFSAWAITIARNSAISHCRKKSPTPLDPALVSSAIKELAPGPEEKQLLIEDSQSVHEALQLLPEILKDVIILHYILDLPLQKVGELLNIPEGTVKSRLFKGRNRLRQILSDAEAQSISSAAD